MCGYQEAHIDIKGHILILGTHVGVSATCRY